MLVSADWKRKPASKLGVVPLLAHRAISGKGARICCGAEIAGTTEATERSTSTELNTRGPTPQFKFAPVFAYLDYFRHRSECLNHGAFPTSVQFCCVHLTPALRTCDLHREIRFTEYKEGLENRASPTTCSCRCPTHVNPMKPATYWGLSSPESRQQQQEHP